MLRKMAWLGCLGIAPTVLAQEDGASKNVPQTVHPRSVEAEPEDRSENKLKDALEELRREREYMKADRLDAKASREATHDRAVDSEGEMLRSRIAELLSRINQTEPAAPIPNATKKAEPTNESANQRIALSQTQFRAGDFETALETLAGISLAKLNGHDRTWTQFLMASCHRHRGRVSEATALYREVAEAREDEFLTESALWHLQFIGWRDELHQQLQD